MTSGLRPRASCARFWTTTCASAMSHGDGGAQGRAGPHGARAGLHHAEPACRAAHDGGARPAHGMRRQGLSVQGLPALPARRRDGASARQATPIACSCSACAISIAPTCPSCSTATVANGRLFPREPPLLPLLDLINAADIEPLWGEDETIGWIYQYFNIARKSAKRCATRSARRRATAANWRCATSSSPRAMWWSSWSTTRSGGSGSTGPAGRPACATAANICW